MRGSGVLSVAAAVEVVVCRNHFLGGNYQDDKDLR